MGTWTSAAPRRRGSQIILHCVGMASRTIHPVARALDAVVTAPPSKSATHRAFVLAALSDGASLVRGPLRADDTDVTLDGLRALGVEVSVSAGAITLHGTAGVARGAARIELRESGTSMRFLLAVAALGSASSVLDGSARLRQRPLEDLSRALVALGGRVHLAGNGRSLPASAGGARPTGGTLVLPGGTSSQFASALLLVAPFLARGLDLTLTPPHVSLPYAEMSVRALEGFGARVHRRSPFSWRVEPAITTGRELRVEGDHSAAGYFLAAAAIAGGRVRVVGLDPQSAQPDTRCGELLARAGCRLSSGSDWIEVEGANVLDPLDVDLSEAPDLAPTLAVVCALARGRSELRGLGHLRHKESDRLALVARNLERLGCRVELHGDRWGIEAPARSRSTEVTIETGSDHRIAMAFAVLGLRVPGITIDDADCVRKSNPRFWDQLDRL